MALTLADVLTSVAYRLGEDASPSDANEKARRVRFINEAYRKICSRHPFWFTEATASFNSVANQEEYTTTDGFPSDFRDMVELRVDNKVYTYIPTSKIFGLYDSTMNLFNYEDLVSNKHWYIFDNTLHILPKTPSNGVNNITMKYYKLPTAVSADAGTFLIPDLYVEGTLSAYCFARLSTQDTERGDASDALNEFEETYKEIVAEDNRRKFYLKSARPVGADYLVD